MIQTAVQSGVKALAILKTFVPVSAVYPEIKDNFDTFRSLVSNLSRTDTLFWCARLNLILSNPEIKDVNAAQQYAVSTLFHQDSINRLNEYIKHQEKSDSLPTVFFRGQLLDLIRWTCLFSEDHANDGTTFEQADVRQRFTQAALVSGNLWANRTYRDRFATTGDIEADRRRAIPAARQAITANESSAEHSRLLSRGVSLYTQTFHKFYPNANAEFLEATGITIEHYLTCVCAFSLNYTNIRPDNVHTTSGIFHTESLHQNLRPEMVPVVAKYLALESQSVDELSAAFSHGSDIPKHTDQFNYLPIIRKPILRTPSGRAIILDSVFHSSKASIGPLFVIVDNLNNKGKQREATTVMGAFGKAFESYVQDLLDKMYPTYGNFLSRRLSRNPSGRKTGVKGEVEIADACLNDVTDIVLFEAKSTFTSDDAILDTINDTYINAIRSSYAAFNVPNARNKGSGQLARSIRDLASGILTPLNNDFSLARGIYPVLVVHDIALGAPGHAEFFVNEFSKALEPEQFLPNGYMKKGRFTVAPLVLMTIEDLENLQSSVENFRLLDFLRDYTNTQSSNVRPSLRDFMAATAVKYRFIHSRELAERALIMIKQSSHMLFQPAVATIS